MFCKAKIRDGQQHISIHLEGPRRPFCTFTRSETDHIYGKDSVVFAGSAGIKLNLPNQIKALDDLYRTLTLTIRSCKDPAPSLSSICILRLFSFSLSMQLVFSRSWLRNRRKSFQDNKEQDASIGWLVQRMTHPSLLRLQHLNATPFFRTWFSSMPSHQDESRSANKMTMMIIRHWSYHMAFSWLAQPGLSWNPQQQFCTNPGITTPFVFIKSERNLDLSANPEELKATAKTIFEHLVCQLEKMVKGLIPTRERKRTRNKH